jgi:HTH-type transcriptional regulator/antitoxin HigA
LESRSKDFFSPKIAFAAKMARKEDATPLQLAWLYRVYNIATRFPAGKYSEDKLQDSLVSLRNLMHERLEIRHIPTILNAAGIRFLIVEPFPGSSIDGVCFWLDSKSPVVALSLRRDYIDNFWFTLIHELKHVEHRHGLDKIFLDTDIIQKIRNETIPEEIQVNGETAEFLIPKRELDDFVIRIRPFFSTAKIMGFAMRLGIHPGIVVGQLQHNSIIGWKQHRRFLEKIRSIITEIAVCDGWGNSIH